MPALGADMEFGTIIQWLVKPGDAIKRGDIIAVVDTEKATIEVEVFESGVIRNILIPEGEKVAVGTLLATIGAESEVAAPVTEVKPNKPIAVQPSIREKRAPIRATVPVAPTAIRSPSVARIEPKIMPRTEPVAPHRLRISPLARRIAADLGIDVSKMTGSGPEGAIVRADVERAAKLTDAPAAVLQPVQAVTTAAVAETPRPGSLARSVLSGDERKVAMRKAIAAAMVRSKREIPHYYLATQIDMSRAIAWLQAENLKRPVTKRLLYAVLLLKAVALAVREIPEMNGFWIDGAFKPSEAVHVGVAVSLRQSGLIAPAIHDVEKKHLDEIMVSLDDLVKRVRAGVLRSSEIADATITVTNLGDQGVESVFGIIYPPQVALVGFGKITERPWANNGMVGAKSVITGTLAADHRASDGHRGGLFLARIERLLQEPEKLDGQ
jgi:pyruvate dehydrogenase E2 component (dihydrolipoyllysine-residue acetyltransferase)